MSVFRVEARGLLPGARNDPVRLRSMRQSAPARGDVMPVTTVVFSCSATTRHVWPPFTLHHSPFIVHYRHQHHISSASFTIHHSSSFIIHHSSFIIHHSSFIIHHLHLNLRKKTQPKTNAGSQCGKRHLIFFTFRCNPGNCNQQSLGSKEIKEYEPCRVQILIFTTRHTRFTVFLYHAKVVSYSSTISACSKSIQWQFAVQLLSTLTSTRLSILRDSDAECDAAFASTLTACQALSCNVQSNAGVIVETKSCFCWVEWWSDLGYGVESE